MIDFGKIKFYTNGSAEQLIADMKNIIADKGFATVNDLCEHIHEPSDYSGARLGWFNLDDVKIIQRPDEPYYYVMFPVIEEITPKDPNVDHPDHYHSRKTGMETIDIMEMICEDLTGSEAIYMSNIVKYISRWKKKNGIEDLKKAKWYLNRLIIKLEEKKETINHE